MHAEYTHEDGPQGRRHACPSPTRAATPGRLSAVSPSGSYPTTSPFPPSHLEAERNRINERGLKFNATASVKLHRSTFFFRVPFSKPECGSADTKLLFFLIRRLLISITRGGKSKRFLYSSRIICTVIKVEVVIPRLHSGSKCSPNIKARSFPQDHFCAKLTEPELLSLHQFF